MSPQILWKLSVIASTIPENKSDYLCKKYVYDSVDNRIESLIKFCRQRQNTSYYPLSKSQQDFWANFIRTGLEKDHFLLEFIASNFICSLSLTSQMNHFLEKKYFLSENNLPYSDFFQFGLSVDCVVFGYHDGELRVLLIERGAEPYEGYWALPGDLVGLDVNLFDSAYKVLHDLTGLHDVFLEQFQTFGAVNRHPVGRVATVGYYALIESDRHNPVASAWARRTKWFPVDELPNLAFDHQEILEHAVATLKRSVRNRPIGFELLSEKFTLADLQKLYEAILGYKFDKPNFRKKILSMNLLIPLDEVQTQVSHRPAKLFKFDESRYEALRKDGFVFDI